ncbi:MAG: hypothetical protein MK132_04165 [Lentisphaerales bacterium]|nr:hypothetical protein [Lentisphaerales bacterium]
MLEEDKREKQTDLTIFFVMVLSFLILTGQFFIQNSNILKLDQLKIYGQTLQAEVLSSKSSFGKKTLKVGFELNGQNYTRRIFLGKAEGINSNSIQLHYLPGEPEKAIYLKAMKKSYIKYMIGWGFTIFAIIFALCFIAKHFLKKQETAV